MTEPKKSTPLPLRVNWGPTLPRPKGCGLRSGEFVSVDHGQDNSLSHHCKEGGGVELGDVEVRREPVKGSARSRRS
jgi:hypothetical protein